MADLARRFSANPLIAPQDLAPGHSGLAVRCVMNPGVFFYDGRIHLAARVAENFAEEEDGWLAVPVLCEGKLQAVRIPLDDPQLDRSDPRVFRHRGRTYLSTLSHIRIFVSDDGTAFRDAALPGIFGEGPHEAYGVEDCRVAALADGRYVMTYTAISEAGYGIGLRTTRDWKTFSHGGMILPPANKDCALFEEPVDGLYTCLHRPSGVIVGGHAIWLARSPDLLRWGNHVCVAQPRPGRWDGARVGAGASPIKTERGWLMIYHGADENHRYCLGALLLDGEDPSRVIARSEEPIMEPLAPYERQGFLSNVVFTNGQHVTGDRVAIYYGAADETVCGAEFSIAEILSGLFES